MSKYKDDRYKRRLPGKGRGLASGAVLCPLCKRYYRTHLRVIDTELVEVESGHDDDCPVITSEF